MIFLFVSLPDFYRKSKINVDGDDLYIYTLYIYTDDNIPFFSKFNLDLVDVFSFYSTNACQSHFTGSIRKRCTLHCC
jgi:hypothetical protein